LSANDCSLAGRPTRGTALGVYVGAMVLVSSVVAGEFWDRVDPVAPFLLGAATGLTSVPQILFSFWGGAGRGER
jgi:hypothetical protein